MTNPQAAAPYGQAPLEVGCLENPTRVSSKKSGFEPLKMPG